MRFFVRLGIFAVTALLIVGCTTWRANSLVVSQFSAEEKAELLFKDGLARYNDELIANDNLKAIPSIRTRFKDALRLDPRHERAAQYLKELEALKKDRFKTHIGIVRELSRKEQRSDDEEYRLALNLRLSGDISPLHPVVLATRISTRKERKALIAIYEQKILDERTAVLAEQNPQRLTRVLPPVNNRLGELEAIDPENKTVADTRNRFDSHVAGIAKADIQTARQQLQNKRFADAEATASRAERTVRSVTNRPNPEIQSLKYDIYLAWAKDALSARRFQTATEKVNQALRIERTPEATELQGRISRTAAVRDYDAEINDILATVDSQIAQGDLTAARDTINTNLPRLRIQANKNRLEAKRATITEKLRVLYQEGVALYNEEDYEAARSRFLAVVRINADYEQAQAYLDRSNTKLRALTGR